LVLTFRLLTAKRWHYSTNIEIKQLDNFAFKISKHILDHTIKGRSFLTANFVVVSMCCWKKQCLHHCL